MPNVERNLKSFVFGTAHRPAFEPVRSLGPKPQGVKGQQHSAGIAGVSEVAQPVRAAPPANLCSHSTCSSALLPAWWREIGAPLAQQAPETSAPKASDLRLPRPLTELQELCRREPFRHMLLWGVLSGSQVSSSNSSLSARGGRTSACDCLAAVRLLTTESPPAAVAAGREKERLALNFPPCQI